MFNGHIAVYSPNIEYSKLDITDDLTISAGSKYYLLYFKEVSVINIAGFGDTEENLSLQMFYYIEGDKSILYSIGVFEIMEQLNLNPKFITLFEDYDNRYFNDARIAKNFDTTELEKYIDSFHVAKVKSGKRHWEKYAENHIGKHDWFIPFRLANHNGMFTLGKIATLTNKFKGKIFLFAASTKEASEYVNAAHNYFILCGIDISPDTCKEYLTKNL